VTPITSEPVVHLVQC